MKIDRKRVRRTCYWLAAELVVLAVFILLMRHKPSGYAPPVVDDSGRVSRYLTHELLQDLYNNVQLQEPFELVVREEGLRDIIATSAWADNVSDETQLSRPTVFFRQGRIVVMMTASVKGMDFVATFDLMPEVNEQGLVHIVLDQANIGAVPMTLVIGPLAKKMYLEQMGGLVRDDIISTITDALFRQEPVDMSFTIDNKRVRITAVRVEEGQLIVGFTPSP